MAVTEVVRDHYVSQATISRQAASAVQDLWWQSDPSALLKSWRPLAENGANVLAAGQYAAASGVQPYLTELAAAQEIQTPPAGQINPAAFAGVAANGGDLLSLLMTPALQALSLMGLGIDLRSAMTTGLNVLTRIVLTEISDSGRRASGVGMTANKGFTVYVRSVRLPACGRCIVLAGRQYPWSTGFARHPQCDCQMVPITVDSRGVSGMMPSSPKKLFDRMSVADQNRAFGKDGAQAIRDGAHMDQVVNASRGVSTVNGKQVTSAGTTVRGFAGRRMGQLEKVPGQKNRRSKTVRPTPAQIYKDAAGDRDEAIRLMKRFAYIT